MGKCFMPLSKSAREGSALVRFVPHPMFSLADANEQIERLKPRGFDENVPPLDPDGLLPQASSLGKLCEEPLLSREAEHYLFLRMNYEKFAATKSQGKTREAHLAQANAVRNRILLANLRLLVSLAGQFATRTVRTEDWVSEGVVPLVKAVELFDVSKGFAFGTYATHVLRNHFRRAGETRQKQHRRLSRLSESQLEFAADESVCASSQAELAQRQGDLAKECLAQLPKVDQTILRARFGFDDPASPKLRSFAEVGEAVGLSKERVRVRARRALELLKETAQERRWEYPELETLNLRA
jgi:RNA polymerase sigma factor (sigma-70 family)